MSDLSEATQNVLKALIRFMESNNGRSPTYKELAAEAGRGIGPVQRRMETLKQRRYVEALEGARGFRVLKYPDGRPYAPFKSGT